jgi:hypothetical protein
LCVCVLFCFVLFLFRILGACVTAARAHQ